MKKYTLSNGEPATIANLLAHFKIYEWCTVTCGGKSIDIKHPYRVHRLSISLIK